MFNLPIIFFADNCNCKTVDLEKAKEGFQEAWYFLVLQQGC